MQLFRVDTYLWKVVYICKYCTNSKETNKSCACFQTRPTILPDLVFACWKQAQDLCVSLPFVQYRYIPICNTKQYIYKTNYAVGHHSRTYNKVYVAVPKMQGICRCTEDADEHSEKHEPPKYVWPHIVILTRNESLTSPKDPGVVQIMYIAVPKMQTSTVSSMS